MRSSGRILTVWSATTLAATALLVVLLPALAPAGDTFTDLLVSGCAAAGSLATGWLWVLVTLVVTDALRGRPARAGVPAGVRRVVLAACGLTLAGGLAAPAHADDSLAGLPLPDRATSTSTWLATVATAPPGPESPEPEPQPIREEPPHVTVAPGDSLWSLARDTLAPDATSDEVDRRWRAIYAANRDAVGADPDLIRPGQRLALPPLSGSTPS